MRKIQEKTPSTEMATNRPLKDIVEQTIKNRPLIPPSISTKGMIKGMAQQIEQIYHTAFSLSTCIKPAYATNSTKQQTTTKRIESLKQRYRTITTDFTKTYDAVNESIRYLTDYETNLDNAITTLNNQKHIFAPDIHFATYEQTEEISYLVLHYAHSKIQNELQSYEASLDQFKKLHKPLTLYVQSMKQNQHEIRSYLDNYHTVLDKTRHIIDMLTLDFS